MCSLAFRLESEADIRTFLSAIEADKLLKPRVHPNTGVWQSVSKSTVHPPLLDLRSTSSPGVISAPQAVAKHHHPSSGGTYEPFGLVGQSPRGNSNVDTPLEHDLSMLISNIAQVASGPSETVPLSDTSGNEDVEQNLMMIWSAFEAASANPHVAYEVYDEDNNQFVALQDGSAVPAQPTPPMPADEDKESTPGASVQDCTQTEDPMEPENFAHSEYYVDEMGDDDFDGRSDNEGSDEDFDGADNIMFVEDEVLLAPESWEEEIKTDPKKTYPLITKWMQEERIQAAAGGLENLQKRQREEQIRFNKLPAEIRKLVGKPTYATAKIDYRARVCLMPLIPEYIRISQNDPRRRPKITALTNSYLFGDDTKGITGFFDLYPDIGPDSANRVFNEPKDRNQHVYRIRRWAAGAVSRYRKLNPTQLPRVSEQKALTLAKQLLAITRRAAVYHYWGKRPEIKPVIDALVAEMRKAHKQAYPATTERELNHLYLSHLLRARISEFNKLPEEEQEQFREAAKSLDPTSPEDIAILHEATLSLVAVLMNALQTKIFGFRAHVIASIPTKDGAAVLIGDYQPLEDGNGFLASHSGGVRTVDDYKIYLGGKMQIDASNIRDMSLPDTSELPTDLLERGDDALPDEGKGKKTTKRSFTMPPPDFRPNDKEDVLGKKMDKWLTIGINAHTGKSRVLWSDFAKNPGNYVDLSTLPPDPEDPEKRLVITRPSYMELKPLRALARHICDSYGNEPPQNAFHLAGERRRVHLPVVSSVPHQVVGASSSSSSKVLKGKKKATKKKSVSKKVEAKLSSASDSEGLMDEAFNKATSQQVVASSKKSKGKKTAAKKKSVSKNEETELTSVSEATTTLTGRG
ncbi:hypothetical protein FRC03_003907 [Tulasnella sp. 419]|nr:hypothetical protein FRC03_003907 [Tulasnella sp. 419]